MSREKLLQILNRYSLSRLYIFAVVGTIGFALLAVHGYAQTAIRKENAAILAFTSLTSRLVSDFEERNYWALRSIT